MSTPPHPIWRNTYRWLSPVLHKLVKLISPLAPKFEKTIYLRSAETWENIPVNQYVFHCASVGEFEAARPIIEVLVQRGFSPIVAMGSPSLESRKLSYSNAGFYWCWSPLDTHSNVSNFLSKVQPKAIIITKHDIWPELVWQSRERTIPVLLQSANFRPDSSRNKAIIRSFQRSLFGALTGIGAISQEDALRFTKLIGHRTQIRVTGDTRFDRVLQNAKQPDKRPPTLSNWIQKKTTVILGSSWKPDEEKLISVISEQDLDTYHFIIVPHETDAEPIRATYERFSSAGFRVKKYSEGLTDLDKFNTLLVDVQGLLATMYRDTKIAWVGGGFGQGVHSVLEPAAFGVPVLFGPNYLMSREARLLIDCQGGFVVNDSGNWQELLKRLLSDDEFHKSASEKCLHLVNESAGAMLNVLEWLESL